MQSGTFARAVKTFVASIGGRRAASGLLDIDRRGSGARERLLPSQGNPLRQGRRHHRDPARDRLDDRDRPHAWLADEPGAAGPQL